MLSDVVSNAVMDDEDALAFLRAIANVLHTWDDLTDHDKPVSDEDVFSAFWTCLIGLPENPFYRQNEGVLRPVLANAIINWRIANNLERSESKTETDMICAFIIRSAYVDLVTASAALIGGVDHAATIGAEVRRWAHKEGFDKYLSNLAAEEAARKGA